MLLVAKTASMNIVRYRPQNVQGIRAKRACVHAGYVILELFPEVRWGSEGFLANAVIAGTVTAAPHTDTWPHLIASSDATDVISRFFEWLLGQVRCRLQPSIFRSRRC